MSDQGLFESGRGVLTSPPAEQLAGAAVDHKARLSQPSLLRDTGRSPIVDAALSRATAWPRAKRPLTHLPSFEPEHPLYGVLVLPSHGSIVKRRLRLDLLGWARPAQDAPGPAICSASSTSCNVPRRTIGTARSSEPKPRASALVFSLQGGQLFLRGSPSWAPPQASCMSSSWH